MEEGVFFRSFDEVLELDGQHEHERPILAGAYVECQLDEHPDLRDLITVVQDGMIVYSEKYTQQDIEEHGLEKVMEWVDEDRRDMQSYGLEWCYRTIVAYAVLMVPLPENDTFSRVTVSSGGTPRLDSRDMNDSVSEAMQVNQITELRDILRVLNVVGLDLIGGHLTLVKG
ncbi:MAG: hypothetical protein PHT33_01010 [bacterium]|nr:hypothetical protein [bacterium]